MDKKDIIGKKFGLLTVIEDKGKGKNYETLWLCKCECGNFTTVRQSNLISGNTKSCGCYRVTSNIKHDSYKTKLYSVYQSMISRCYRERFNGYKNYGGRGIKVCAEWLGNFEVFKKWAVENGYDECAKRGKCTIDRIDVNGNYEPSNCRWVDMKVQNNNRRNNKEVKGE